MNKAIFPIIFLFFVNLTIGQEKIIPTKQTQIGFAAFDFLSIQMPNNEFGFPEENMNFAGMHYNLWINKSVYAGLGFYGSVAGQRGGLFTLGVNLGYQKNIDKNFFLDTGIHFGGGGGASAPDGGGAFILPHLNIGYHFKNISATAGYSYINFFDKGNIISHQFNVGIQIPLTYEYAFFSKKEKKYSITSLEKSEWNQRIKKISLLFHLDNLSPFANSTFTDGSTLVGHNIYLAGFELNAYLNNSWFTYFRADGAFHGIQGGYMDIFLGGGYQYSMNQDRTNLIAKFGIGAGGGGGVDTGGGFLIAPSISLEQKLFKGLYLAVNKGYLMNIDNRFSTSSLGFGIKYYVNQQGVKGSTDQHFTVGKFKGIQFIIGQETYFNAKRMLQPTENLSQIALQVNLFINDYIYLAGQTSFANFGNAGAYAEGIVGVGINSKSLFNKRIDFFTQVLAGAAGGGDISIGQGLLIKPSVGFNYQLNERLNLRAAIGKVLAKAGDLSSTSLSIGINYQLAFLKVD